MTVVVEKVLVQQKFFFVRRDFGLKFGIEPVPRTYGPWPMARAEAIDTGCQRDIGEIWNPIPNH